MFVKEWTAVQRDKMIDMLDPATEIVVVCDYAAKYEMEQRDVGTETCSHGTCSQYVAIVIYFEFNGKTFVRKTDVFRGWSEADSSAAYHHAMLKEIVEAMRTPVQRLSKVYVVSDNCHHQFKGHKNFGLLAACPHHPNVPPSEPCHCREGGLACGKPLAPGLGVTVVHDFLAAHNASGPVDSYGKDPRTAMDNASSFGRAQRYNARSCYQWCCQNMAGPSSKKRHRGVFAATGQYHFRYLEQQARRPGRMAASEEAAQEVPADVVPIWPDQEFQTLTGSNELYHFKADRFDVPMVKASFIPCYCVHHKHGQPELCRFRDWVQSNVSGSEYEDENLVHTRA